MVEYNQCQAMLKNLYEMGIRGCNDEFTAYRILMFLHGMNRSGSITRLSLHDGSNKLHRFEFSCRSTY